MDTYKIFDTLREHLDAANKTYSNKGLTPFFIGLYGSQNYGLDTENSDIDSKCMVIPDLHHLIFDKKRLSTDLEVGGALCNIKDLREMCDNFYKGNPNFIEILYTPHLIYDGAYHISVCKLLMGRDKIAHRNIPKLFAMIGGMARQKYVAFDKPFASKLKIIEQYGFDPKQLCHLVRLNVLLKDFLDTESFGDALKPNKYSDKEFLLQLKKGSIEYSKAKSLKEKTMQEIDETIKKFTPKFQLSTEEQSKKDLEVKEILENFCYEVISKGVLS